MFDWTSATPAFGKPVTSCTKSGEWSDALNTSFTKLIPKVELQDVCSETLMTTAFPEKRPDITWLIKL